MSTNSLITALCSDGKYRTIYCHWDGYIEHNGKILFEHYKDQAKIDLLVEQGDLTKLAEECTKPDEHTFYEPVKGYCIYYKRDRGEPDCDPSVGTTAAESMQKCRYGNREYRYFWDGSSWYTIGVTRLTKEIISKTLLSEALSEQNEEAK